MRLIQERAGHWYPGVCEDRIPARLLVLEPAPDALSIGRSCRGGHMIGKASSPVHLTKKSNIEVQELAFYYLDSGA